MLVSLYSLKMRGIKEKEINVSQYNCIMISLFKVSWKLICGEILFLHIKEFEIFQVHLEI